MSQMMPTGMVTSSPTNPLDQIPVGPQVFPFGTPTESQSHVEPYLASNYPGGIKSSQIQTTDATYQTVDATNYITQVQAVDALPATNYDVTALATDALPAANYDVTALATDALPAVNYDATAIAAEALPVANNDASALAQYQMVEALPAAEGVYDAGAYQTAAQYTEGYATGYQYRTVMKPVVKTGYQTVVRYKPVTKTTLVPKVTTKYVPVTKNAVNPAVSTLGTVPQQSLALTQTTPLVASSLQTSAITPQPIAMTASPLSMGGDSHFVSNYPIYENDPRRTGII